MSNRLYVYIFIICLCVRNLGINYDSLAPINILVDGTRKILIHRALR